MKKLLTAIFSIMIASFLILSANMISFAYDNNFPPEFGITYDFDKQSGELCIEGYGMIWNVWSVQYHLDFDENIDQTEVKKLLVKDGLTILDCHTLVGSLFEWENLTEMTLPKSIKKIQGDFSRCPSLKTIHYAGTQEDWNKIIFRDNQKELFSEMNFNYSVDVPQSDSGFSGRGNEIVEVKTDSGLKCKLNCITEELVVSGQGSLQISSGPYSDITTVSGLFRRGNGQDDTWTPYISDIVIEEGITKICENNFVGVYNSVVIPKSVTKIEPNSFGSLNDNYRESENKKMDVYYAGSEADWNKIEIGDMNDELINGNLHFAEENAAAGNSMEKSPYTVYIIAGALAAVLLIAVVFVLIVIKRKKNK